MTDTTDDLPTRLREHAAIHDAATSPYDDEQAQWARDLREAADELERRREAMNPGTKMPAGCVCPPDSWDCNDIEPICDSYDGTMGEHCWHCEHDKACHKP